MLFRATTKKMAPVIHCIRHAQGKHNLGRKYWGETDPKLTPLGEMQCLQLRQTSFADQSNVSLVVASPMQRTLNTAWRIFKPALTTSERCHRHILALPDLQELANCPSDTGSSLDELKRVLAKEGLPVDLSLVPENWTEKGPKSRYSTYVYAIILRARDARLQIRRQARELVQAGIPDPEIAVVTHGAFLHFLTEDWENANVLSGTGWQNCEHRSYTFDHNIADDGHGAANARLVETTESREKRGLTWPMRKDQATLFDATMALWELEKLYWPANFGIEQTQVEDKKLPVIEQVPPTEEGKVDVHAAAESAGAPVIVEVPGTEVTKNVSHALPQSAGRPESMGVTNWRCSPTGSGGKSKL
jgi:broad specificity phosphatase PhoE